MHKLRGNFFVNSYVKPQFLTHDPGRIASYRADPLITRPIAVNILLGLYEAAERVVAGRTGHHAAGAAADLGQRLGGAQKPQHDFFDRLGSAVKSKHRAARLLPRHAGRARPRRGREGRARVRAATASTPRTGGGPAPGAPPGPHRDEARALPAAAVARVAARPVLGGSHAPA
jgi:hypothetical protein